VALVPGQVVQLGCYWEPRPDPPDVRITLRLESLAGAPVVALERAPDEDRATTHLWTPGQVYPDLQNIQVPPGLAPGVYRLLIGVHAADAPVELIALPLEVVVGP
jgi:hypothetical protein